MAININGNNYGIAVEGDLSIDHLEFSWGKGVESASGIHRPVVEEATLVEEEAASAPSPSYPPITEAQERFFEKWRWVVIDKMTGKITDKTTGNLEKTEEKRKVDVKLEQLMHSIFDYTHQYDWNPEDTNSVHRWRMLYDLLGQQKFFKEGERKRYRPFVDAVVRYCYPEVRNTYNDNLRQTALPESFHHWAKEDWEEYRRLKAIILA